MHRVLPSFSNNHIRFPDPPNSVSKVDSHRVRETLTILNQEPSSLKKVYKDQDLQQNASLGEEHSPTLFQVTSRKPIRCRLNHNSALTYI